MPTIKITDSLRELIKEERKKRKIRGDVLSLEIDKSASYISQIEKGNIATMDISLLYNIFDRIIDLPEKDLPDYISSLINNSELELSEDEIRTEEWRWNLEYQFRRFPITDDLINLIQNKLSNLGLTSKELIQQINRNIDLLNDDTLDNLQDNKVFIKCYPDGKLSTKIKFNLEENLIDDILKKKVKSINKITIQGILYNLFMLEGLNSVDAKLCTENKLNALKFFTLYERNKLVKKAESNNLQYQELILEEDSQCNSYINKILKHLIELRDLNPVLGIEILSNFNTLLEDDKKLIFTLLSLDLIKLKVLSDTKKKSFINDVKELINNYSEKLDKDDLLL